MILGSLPQPVAHGVPAPVPTCSVEGSISCAEAEIARANRVNRQTMVATRRITFFPPLFRETHSHTMGVHFPYQPKPCEKSCILFCRFVFCDVAPDALTGH